MSSAAGPSDPVPALVRVLDDVAAWRERVGQEIDHALSLLAAEERAVRRELDEAQRRYGAIGVIRKEEEERLTTINEEAVRRKRAGVREAMVLDRNLLEERAALLGELQARRDAELAVGLDDPATNAALVELLEAQEEAAGMRGDAADHELRLSPDAHDRLAPYLRAAAAPPPGLAVPPAGVGVLVSADPPVGSPEALVMVLPVPWAVYGEGTIRAEDLCTLVAYRLVAALYRLLGSLGVGHAPVRFSELQGSLAVQVWLGDHLVPDDLRERMLDCIAAGVEGAPELEAARVEVYAVWLTPDLLAEAVA